MDGDLIIRYFLLHCKGFIGDVKLNLTNKPAPSEYDQRETNDSCNYHTRGKTCLDGGQILNVSTVTLKRCVSGATKHWLNMV